MYVPYIPIYKYIVKTRNFKNRLSADQRTLIKCTMTHSQQHNEHKITMKYEWMRRFL